MPKYRRRSRETKTFQNQIPQDFNSLKHYTLFASRLQPHELNSLKELARHYNGKKTQYHNKIPSTPDKKILKGVWDDFERLESGTDLAAGIISEHHQHIHDENFHKGGGLWDGFKSLVGTAWNYGTSYFKPLGWVQDSVDWAMGYKHDDEIPKSVRQRVDLILDAKKPPNDRKNIHGWTYDQKNSTDRVAVYVDKNKKEIHTCVRGTNTEIGTMKNAQDLMEDAKILFKGSPDSTDVKNTLINVAKQYNDYDLSALGYSLGGSQLTKCIYYRKRGRETIFGQI